VTFFALSLLSRVRQDFALVDKTITQRIAYTSYAMSADENDGSARLRLSLICASPIRLRVLILLS
jgi:hypothetical protein